LLVFGDETQESNAARWKALWDSEPENPGFYLVYANAYQRDFDNLPPDYLEIGAKLDPGNGWFQLMASADQTEAAITRQRRPGGKPGERHSGVASPYTIEDPELLEALIQQVHEAAHAEMLDNYAAELGERRYAALPPPDGILVNLWRSTVMGMTSTGYIHLQRLAQLVAAAAQHQAESGDLAAFQVLVEDWEILTHRLLDRQVDLLDNMIIRVSLGATYPSFRDAAITLNAPEKEALIQRELRIREHAIKLDEARAARDSEHDQISRHGSVLTSLTLPMISSQVLEPPPVTKAELLPATRADNGLVARVLSAGLWVLLALAVLLLGMAEVGDRRIFKSLKHRLTSLFHARDHAWIIIAGGIVPILFYLALRYATPLARLDWGPRLTFYAIPLAQFACLLIMILSWSLVIARWRLERATGFLTWKRGRFRLHWLILVCAPLAMLMSGLAVPFGPVSTISLWTTAILAGINILWLLGAFSLRAFAKSRHRLRRACIADAMIPALIVAMLAPPLLVPHFHGEEHHWLAKDEFTSLGARATKAEERITRQLNAEIRALLAPE